MAALPFPIRDEVSRKPPVAAQYNWITGGTDVAPEQLELGLPPLDDAVLPDDGTAILLATENGSQLLVSGFGLFLGKKSERIVVKQGKKICAQVPLMRLQELVIASRGISLSSDLIEELCERGIRIACLTSSGKPFALVTSPMLTATRTPDSCLHIPESFQGVGIHPAIATVQSMGTVPEGENGC